MRRSTAVAALLLFTGRTAAAQEPVERLGINIIRTEVQPDDRPYAGWLSGSFGWSTLQSPTARGLSNWWSSTQSSTELIVGVTGPPSYAQNTQSLAHWAWSSGSGQPQNWDNQLGTMLHVNLNNHYAARPQLKGFEWCLGSGGAPDRSTRSASGTSRRAPSSHSAP